VDQEASPVRALDDAVADADNELSLPDSESSSPEYVER
jgi:hypothetical protein